MDEVPQARRITSGLEVRMERERRELGFLSAASHLKVLVAVAAEEEEEEEEEEELEELEEEAGAAAEPEDAPIAAAAAGSTRGGTSKAVQMAGGRWSHRLPSRFPLLLGVTLMSYTLATCHSPPTLHSTWPTAPPTSSSRQSRVWVWRAERRGVKAVSASSGMHTPLRGSHWS